MRIRVDRNVVGSAILMLALPVLAPGCGLDCADAEHAGSAEPANGGDCPCAEQDHDAGEPEEASCVEEDGSCPSDAEPGPSSPGQEAPPPDLVVGGCFPPHC
jgi:hypothetical protein